VDRCVFPDATGSYGLTAGGVLPRDGQHPFLPLARGTASGGMVEWLHHPYG
jgi:hypothetical protein